MIPGLNHRAAKARFTLWGLVYPPIEYLDGKSDFTIPAPCLLLPCWKCLVNAKVLHTNTLYGPSTTTYNHSQECHHAHKRRPRALEFLLYPSSKRGIQTR